MPRRLTIDLDNSHHDFVALLRLLEGQHAYAAVIHPDKRKLLAERSRMLRTFEGDEGIVQAIGLPIGLFLTPIAPMPGESKHNVMMAQILSSLVCIAAASSGSSD